MMLVHLPHRVVIQTEVRSEFQGGAYTTSWETASTEWANVQYNASQSKETYDTEKKQQISIYDVITRQDITLTNKNRILYNDNIFVVEDEGDPTMRGRMKVTKCRLENT